jgi:hypothetical protein
LDADWILIQMLGAGTERARAWFNLATGTVGTVTAISPATNVTASIQALADGWYRCSVTGTLNGTGSTLDAFNRVVASDNSITGVTGERYLWGAQLEAASFASSYVKSEAASATRAADVLTYTAGVSYPLSLWAEFERVVDTGAEEHIFQTDTGSNNDRALLYVRSVDLAAAFAASNNVSQMDVSISGVLATGAVYQLAARFATDDGNAARDGNLGTVDTSVTVPATPNTVRFGQRIGGTNQPFGYIRRAAIFNSALTDAQLQTTTGP